MFPWSYDAAFIGALITNMMRGKNDKPRSVFDFMPADIEQIDPMEVTWQNLRKMAGVKDGKH